MRSVRPPALTAIAVLVAVVVAGCASTDASVQVRGATALGATPPPSAAPVVTEPPTTTPATEPPATEAPTTEPQPRTTEPTGPAFELDPDKPIQPYDAYLVAAVNDIQDFWRSTFPTVYRGVYQELSGGLIPVYAGKQDVPGCGEPRTTYEDIRGNAFYCFEGDFIAYDDSELMPDLNADLGPVVIGVVLAHEWGHAIQRRIDYEDATIYMEQQADCFSGAWIAHLARGENPDLSLADDELKSAMNGMIQVRDTPGTGIQEAGAHGTAFDRVGAFQDGFLNGVGKCATYPQDKPQVLSFRYVDGQEDAPFESSGTSGTDEPPDIFTLMSNELNVFWPQRIEGMPTLTIAPYQGDPGDACDDRPSPSLDVAFYCPDSGEVLVNFSLARQFYDSLRDFSVGYLLAEAWSEAAQTALGSDLDGEQRVLANDCFVGAFARSTLPNTVNPNRSTTNTTLSPGDLDEAVSTAIEVGDDRADTNDLGSPFEKIDAFRAGVLGDLAACQDRFGV